MNLSYTRAADFIAFDTETATAQLNSLCQVGFVLVSQGEIIRSETFYVRPPGNEYAVRNSCLHGIDALVTKDSPEFPEVWDNIHDLFTSNLLVAHNSAFDLAVLRNTLTFYNLEVPEFSCECTYQMSRLDLASLCDALEIELTHHHDALADASACAIAYLKMKLGIKPNHRLIKPKTAPDFFAGHEHLCGDVLRKDLSNADPNHQFYNKKVVFTGVLDTISREDAARAVKAHGADIDSGVTKRTDYVIVGSGAGPAKLKKIEQFNKEGSSIKMISEDEFLGMIKDYLI
jgi:DNA polymerase III subunit epsilon